MSQLNAENLIKRYQSRSVVNDVSVQVGSGEVVGLLGPNGAGKTTCFYMIVGLIGCDGGSIRLDEREHGAALGGFSPVHSKSLTALYFPNALSPRASRHHADPGS